MRHLPLMAWLTFNPKRSAAVGGGLLKVTEDETGGDYGGFFRYNFQCSVLQMSFFFFFHNSRSIINLYTVIDSHLYEFNSYQTPLNTECMIKLGQSSELSVMAAAMPIVST